MTITAPLFAQLIHLPAGTSVSPEDITVLVEHPDIPAGVTTVTPTFIRDNEDVMFVDWGAK
jgi:hypothetical protein